ncbi:hypothetical protein LJC72_00095 [Bacteroides sp. OttesenSCG-928-D19]|nr:hypothetical protein [Bacteroides sp. OttesenSCG-928-D19]
MATTSIILPLQYGDDSQWKYVALRTGVAAPHKLFQRVGPMKSVVEGGKGDSGSLPDRVSSSFIYVRVCV